MTRSLRRLVWWSALYDLVVTTPFATPFTAPLIIRHLHALHTALGLGGTIPEFAPMHLFFVNLFGTVVVLWSVIRLLDPTPRYAAFDGAGRLLFSAWMAIYFWHYGGSGLLLLFLVPELAWGIAQLWGWARYRQHARGHGSLAAETR